MRGGGQVVTKKLNLYCLTQGFHLMKCSLHILENYTFKKQSLNSSEKPNFKCHSLLVNNLDTSENGNVEMLATI